MTLHLPKTLSVLLAAAILFWIGPAAAQSDVEAKYLDYHRAIYAAVLCEHRDLEQTTVGDPNAAQLAAAHQKLAQAIDSKIEDQIGAGRRGHLIEQAKADVRELKAKKGCADPEMRRLLAIFHTELEPALTQ